MPPNRLKVAIFGYGAVGRALAELLAQRRDRYASLYGRDVRLVGVRRFVSRSSIGTASIPRRWTPTRAGSRPTTAFTMRPTSSSRRDRPTRAPAAPGSPPPSGCSRAAAT